MRAKEVEVMLKRLDADRTLVGKIDMLPTNIHAYARKFGYKVTVHDNKDGTCEVRVLDNLKGKQNN